MIETIYEINCPQKIALIADFHNDNPQPILLSLKKQHPDIICIVGDFIDRKKIYQNSFEETHQSTMILLRTCATIAPSFVSIGNHELDLTPSEWNIIESTGVTVLNNTWLNHNGMVIGGISSRFIPGYHNWQKKWIPYINSTNEACSFRLPQDVILQMNTFFAWIESYRKTVGYHVLMCHHPEYYPFLQSIDLILSGHTHGGQMTLFGHGLFAPGQGLFPQFASGRYPVNNSCLIISRGLSSSHTHIPRFFNPSEIVYIK